MYAYLTDDRCWLQWKEKRGYVTWQGRNIFLAPAHNWMNNCIQDWNQKWYPVLMTIAVWPNCCQGIITMLSGGTVGLLRKLIRDKKMKVGNPSLAPKGAGPKFF